MNLTPEDEDALIEIGNIGMSKAAKQLSVLLQSAISITIPKISLIHAIEVSKLEGCNTPDVFSFVYQTLTDELEGYAALAFKREQTNVLTTAVLGKMPQLTPDEARACEQEAVLEIGNIIISSCMSVLSNLIAKKIQLSLPFYDENKVMPLLKKLCKSFTPHAEEILIISTRLDSEKDKMSGNLFLILSKLSAEAIVQGVKGILNG